MSKKNDWKKRDGIVYSTESSFQFNYLSRTQKRYFKTVLLKNCSNYSLDNNFFAVSLIQCLMRGEFSICEFKNIRIDLIIRSVKFVLVNSNDKT